LQPVLCLPRTNRLRQPNLLLSGQFLALFQAILMFRFGEISDNTTVVFQNPPFRGPVLRIEQPQALKEAKVAPLQVRCPASDVKAANLAATQLDFPTVSEFVITCIPASMKTTKKP